MHEYETLSNTELGTYNLLDLTPKGRDEHNPAYPMDWVRHHDRYESALPAKPAPVAGSCCHAQA